MQPHIERTIEDIELKIGFLRRMADALRSFGTAADIGAALPAPEPPVLKSARENGHRINKPAPAMKACRPSARGKETIRLVAIVEKMPEPFTAPAIAAKAGVDNKKAGNFITASLRKGWLTQVKRGEYKRLAGFGGGVLGGGGEGLLAEIHREIDSQKPKAD